MRVPATPPDVESSRLLWAESVPAGSYATRVLGRGTRLRLIDPDGGACAHLLLFRSDAPWERLNVADTVKVPWQAYLGAGHPLLSDQGRVLAAIAADSSGRHDALCGTTALAKNEERYGEGSPQGPSPAGRELQLLAAAKHGLGPRDIPPSLSFFQGVKVDADGTLRFEGSAGAGAAVELRIELPTIAIVANVPHPLDPRPEYTATTLELLAWRGDATGPEDELWSRGPELERAY